MEGGEEGRRRERVRREGDNIHHFMLIQYTQLSLCLPLAGREQATYTEEAGNVSHMVDTSALH